jgi:hypothetical protein
LEQEITVTSAKAAVGGDFGAFYWPANYSLSEAADAKLGGWIIQHVEITYQFWPAGKPEPKPGTKPPPHPAIQGQGKKYLKWYEGFRIPPNKKEPEKRRLNEKYITSLGNDHIENATDSANDFYTSTDAGHNTEGWLETKGKLYFFDCLGEKFIDFTSKILANYGFKKRSDVPAGDLPSLPDDPNFKKEIDDLFARKPKPTVGKQEHNIKIKWGAKTTIVSQEPK